MSPSACHSTFIHFSGHSEDLMLLVKAARGQKVYTPDPMSLFKGETTGDERTRQLFANLSAQLEQQGILVLSTRYAANQVRVSLDHLGYRMAEEAEDYYDDMESPFMTDVPQNDGKYFEVKI